MRRVVIVGGGFAGLGALRIVQKNVRDATILLIDPKPTSDFLPLLPDVAGGRIVAAHVRFPLDRVCRGPGVQWVADEMAGVDIARRRLVCRGRTEGFDAMVLACGSQTNFYGRTDLPSLALKLDSADDAQRIQAEITATPPPVVVIAGGGYTGIELATCLWRCLRRRKARGRVCIVEIAADILTSMPSWIRAYVRRNLDRMGIEVIAGRQVADAGNAGVRLDDGRWFEGGRLVWAAGVCTPPAISGLDLEKTRQGRLRVDRTLRVAEGIFAVGDCAAFRHDGSDLRMSVQFALAQGQVAGRNVCRHLSAQPLAEFHPRDPGYIIPMANGRSCGVVLGVPVRGCAATGLHYFMSALRSRGPRNRIGVLADSLIR